MASDLKPVISGSGRKGKQKRKDAEAGNVSDESELTEQEEEDRDGQDYDDEEEETSRTLSALHSAHSAFHADTLPDQRNEVEVEQRNERDRRGPFRQFPRATSPPLFRLRLRNERSRPPPVGRPQQQRRPQRGEQR